MHMDACRVENMAAIILDTMCSVQVVGASTSHKI